MDTYEQLKAKASKIGVIDVTGPNVWHESPGDQEAFNKDTAVPNAPESPQPPVDCTPNEVAFANLIAEQGEKIKSLTDALTELVHLHACEQEGLQSGKPTPEQWFNAINKAHDALWPRADKETDVCNHPSTDKGPDGIYCVVCLEVIHPYSQSTDKP